MRKVILIGIILAGTLAGPAGAEQTASITGITGGAVVVRGDQSIPAEKGMVLQKGDIIRTDPEGGVDLSLNGCAGFRLRGATEFRLDNIHEEDMITNISSGGLIANLQKLPDHASFRVETPTAIAAVRGTQFMANVNLSNPGNPTSSFAVRDGSVDVSVMGSQDTFTLGQGQGLDIPKDFSGGLVVRDAFNAELATLDQASTVPTCS